MKDKMRCKRSHIAMLLECNSCVTDRVMSSILLVSTEQESNWKVENNLKKGKAVTDVSVLQLLSL